MAEVCLHGRPSKAFLTDEGDVSSITSKLIAKSGRLSAIESRTLAIASFGSAFELYDFVVFVFLSNVVAQLFFPADLPMWMRQVQTLAIFAAGYIARPLGGIFMGQMSDRRGRKTTFTLTVFVMAISTLLIGCLPTYKAAGIVAPLLLLLLRIGQGVAIGGEAPAAWVFVAENVPAGRQGMAIGLLTAGLSSGILLGSLASLSLSEFCTPAEILNGAWRIAFILGGLFGLSTAIFRRQVAESPVFQEMRKRAARSGDMPIQTVVAHHRGAVALSMVLTWFLSAIIIVAILAGPALLHGRLATLPLHEVQVANAACTLSLCLSTATLGFLSDRFGMRRVFGPALLLLIASNYLLYIVPHSFMPGAIVFFNILVGIGAGATVLTPIVMVRSFPAPLRVTGVAFSYNTAYAVFGGATLPLIGWLNHMNRLAPAHYIGLAATVALIVVSLKRLDPSA
jgi:MFS family permease